MEPTKGFFSIAICYMKCVRLQYQIMSEITKKVTLYIESNPILYFSDYTAHRITRRSTQKLTASCYFLIDKVKEHQIIR